MILYQFLLQFFTVHKSAAVTVEKGVEKGANIPIRILILSAKKNILERVPMKEPSFQSDPR